jgi:ATP-dependent DNA helicase DinG
MMASAPGQPCFEPDRAVNGALQEAIEEAFADGGALAQTQTAYRSRAGQLDMARAVGQSISEGSALVVEAGTGVGKTYAYLVPVLLSGQRALISTASKALQDQLFSRDIPQLTQALGLPVQVALLKGRSSYLCVHRMGLARAEGMLSSAKQAQDLRKVEQWAQATRTGELSELTGLDDQSSLMGWITSTRENCLGSACPSFGQCHLQLARRTALAADVVVINHHLFFADMAVRESGFAELLPTAQVVVFDEAHQLNEIGVHFLGQSLSTTQVLTLCADVLGAGLQLARSAADWSALVGPLDRSARDLRLCVGAVKNGAQRRAWKGVAPDGIAAEAWTDHLQALQSAALSLLEKVQLMRDTAPDFVRLADRLEQMLAACESFFGVCPDQAVRALEVAQSDLTLSQLPLDIAHTVQHKWLGLPQTDVAQNLLTMDDETARFWQESVAPAAAKQQRAWIFTSATLGEDERLSWFTEPCGLQTARCLQVSSPFDYPQQAALYVPAHFPKPNEPTHSSAIAQWLVPVVRRLNGRTLVLTTTVQAMQQIAKSLGESLSADGDPRVLMQGQSPKRRLMEQFRAAVHKGEQPCVLVATASFWEGFDVPGEALQLVLIDKLPFPVPSDPMVAARSERLEKQGRSAFGDHALPEAAVALKQGAGRLIRTETDRGILVLADVRLRQMSYGRRLLKSLPPMRWLRDATEFDALLGDLTRPSTTVCPAAPGSSE